MLLTILFFIFAQITLLIPGYAFIKKFGWLTKKPDLEIILAYALTIFFYGTLALLSYALKINPWGSRSLTWIVLLASLVLFIKERYWQPLLKLRFPLICMVLMSLFSLAFISLPLNSPRTFVPDPKPEAGRNYSTLNVKVLNVAHTQANDNYVPYRQAQFMINRSDPARDSFIGEWGVTFFERTPLMGGVTANYFNILREKVPIDYTWSATSKDSSHTYLQFQILAQILNSLLVIPGYFLIKKLLNKKTAQVTLLFSVPSIYFLYDSFFSWPKSLVSFFILTSWLLLLEKKSSYTLLAGLVSGAAYLTHDLAFLYIGASIFVLLCYRRFMDILIFLALIVALAAPWLLVSSVKYHTPTTFTEYPFSTTGIPGAGQTKQLIHSFLHTSPLRILKIRIDNIVYLLSPYQLLSSEGGNTIAPRLWSLSLYSVTGALGLGLIIPVFIGALRQWRNWLLWSFAVLPVLFCALFIGWPKGLGALHFAEGAVLLLTAVGVYYLLSLKNSLFLVLAFIVNFAQLAFFISYSYYSSVGGWFVHPKSLSLLILMVCVVFFCAQTAYLLSRGRSSWVAANS